MTTENEERPYHDPYANCERSCTHDLARGILTKDLQEDGPYPHPIYDKQGTGPLAQALRVARAAEQERRDATHGNT